MIDHSLKSFIRSAVSWILRIYYSKNRSIGVFGTELHLHGNGIDFSRISEKYVPATTSVSSIDCSIKLKLYSIRKWPTFFSSLSSWNRSC